VSATITSNLSSTTTTAYAWTGEANNSPSVKRVNGVEVGRNHVTRPLVEALTSQVANATQSASQAWSTSGGASVELAPRTDRASNDTFLSVETAGLVVGQTYTLSADIQVPRAQVGSLRGNQARGITVFGPAEGNVFSEQAPNVAGTAQRLSVTFTVGTGALIIRLYNGSDNAADIIRWDSPLIARADQAQTYFAGDTYGSSVTAPDTTEPVLVLGYETSRRSQNIYHDVLGGGQDVTLRPAALRTGTLRLLFADEDSARDAVAMHAKAALFYFEDPDRRIATMYYAIDGDVRLALHEQRELWTVDVAYREVNP